MPTQELLYESRAVPPYGGVAQLGEHLPCKQGVMGSNPIISTSRKLRHPRKGIRLTDNPISKKWIESEHNDIGS